MREEKRWNRRNKNCAEQSGNNAAEQEYKYGENTLSRSRALGIIILVCGLFLFQISVFVFEKIGTASEPVPKAVEKQQCTEDNNNEYSTKREHHLFEFDPNTISQDSLCLLGFSPKQAQSIVKYRDKGGRFRKKEDFARMYVVSRQMYEKLLGYIAIKKDSELDNTAKVKNKSSEWQREEKLKKSQKSEPKKIHKIVDLNKADSATLVTLYGIGGYYARKILDYRAKLGNFYTPEQLMEIDGIDSTRYAGLAKMVTADPSLVKSFSLDTASKFFLIKHPYIGAYAARGIILMREKLGIGSCTLENLVKERIISEEVAKKLWYYIE